VEVVVIRHLDRALWGEGEEKGGIKDEGQRANESVCEWNSERFIPSNTVSTFSFRTVRFLV
jgi:hypothetical protein